jgi:hypothetical protein
MTQALYAHMNKTTTTTKKNKVDMAKKKNSSEKCTMHFFVKHFPFGILMWVTGTCTFHSFSDLAILNVPSPQM